MHASRAFMSAAVAAALLVALPASSAAAGLRADTADLVDVPTVASLVRPPATRVEVGCDTGPIADDTADVPEGGGSTELETVPPHASFTLQDFARIGATVEVILNESTGDIAFQHLCVDRPGGEWYFTVTFDGLPNANDWVAFSVPDPGLYTVTLTVGGLGGLDRVTHSVHVV